MEASPKLGVPFQGPYNEDYDSSGSVLGPPHFGKLLCLPLQTREMSWSGRSEAPSSRCVPDP